MTASSPPPLRREWTTGLVLRWTAWALLWLAGVWLASVSVLHILGDRHTWDARVSLPVRAADTQAVAPFRTLGGSVNVMATSLVHGNTGRAPFRGTIAIRVLQGNGTPVHAWTLGRGGVAHEQSTDSSWTTLGQVNAPALVFQPWRLEAHVQAGDAAFPATHIDVMLRKERRDLGMGGMVYYVTIFAGLFLLLIALLFAIRWRAMLGRVPWIVSAFGLAAFVGVWVVTR